MRIAAVLTLVFLMAPSQAQDKNTMTITVEKDLAISDFLDQISQATGKPILYDPNGQRIRGQKLGASFSRTVPKDRVLDVFRAILAFYELTLVPVGPRDFEVYLVIDSRSTNTFVKNKALYVDYRKIEDFADRDGVYVSCAVPIKHIENLTTLRTALSTMVSPAGIGRVHEVPGSQSIILMDFAPTVAAMTRLIRQMDVAPEGTERVLRVIELRHATAKDLATAINDVLATEASAPAARGRTAFYRVQRIKPKVVPYGPRNALLVSCMESHFRRIQDLVATLDKPQKRLEAVDSR